MCSCMKMEERCEETTGGILVWSCKDRHCTLSMNSKQHRYHSSKNIQVMIRKPDETTVVFKRKL